MEQPFHSSAELARNSQQELGPAHQWTNTVLHGLCDAPIPACRLARPSTHLRGALRLDHELRRFIGDLRQPLLEGGQWNKIAGSRPALGRPHNLYCQSSSSTAAAPECWVIQPPQQVCPWDYPDQPEGLLALDPQLVCYSWITGEPNVGFVVFVRKRLVEVQYLRATITQEQRERFGEMVASTIRQIEAAHFPARSGIRFPQNGCLSCSHLGLCLEKQDLVDSKLIRRPGGDLGWLDQLDF